MGQGRGYFGDGEPCLLSRFPVANPAKAIVFTNSAASAGWSERRPSRRRGNPDNRRSASAD